MRKINPHDFKVARRGTSREINRQIALKISYERSSLISMFKQGQTRVPVEKVRALADSQLATIRRRAGDGERLEDRARRASSRPAGPAASKYPRRRPGVIGCPSK